MKTELVILILEAISVYLLVLAAHSMRGRFGIAHFYALMGGITAVMSWVTDAGVKVEVAGITFLVGSTVFYTSLLLGVFVVYVFDGPRATRTAISTVAGVSVMVPVIAAVLHLQAVFSGHPALARVRKLEDCLPVCSGCRKIRVDAPSPDERDRWVSLEEYMQEEASVRFTHGMCVDCMRQLYPDEVEEWIAEERRTFDIRGKIGATTQLLGAQEAG